MAFISMKKDRRVVDRHFSHDRDEDSWMASSRSSTSITGVMGTAVIGAGSLGRWLAAKMQASGNVVTLVTRPGSAAGPLSCQVKSLDGNLQQTLESAPAAALTAGGFQRLFYCTKAKDLRDAAQETSHLLSPDGVAVLLSNGLGHVESLATAGMSRCLVASVTYGLCPDENGVVEERGTGGLVQVGPLSSECATPASVADAKLLSGLFQDAGLQSLATEDGDELIWKKAMLNAGLNPVCALLRQENGALPGTASFALSIEAAREVIQVAKEVGVDLSDIDPERLLVDLCQDTATNRCSTLQDLDRGQPTEMEWICGAVVRIAERFGIETPANRLLAKLVQDVEVASVAI